MQKYSSVITIERFLVQNFANYRTMAEISTAKNSLPKSPTELEKDGPSFSSLFSLASACATGDIAPLRVLSVQKGFKSALYKAHFFQTSIPADMHSHTEWTYYLNTG